MQRDNSKFWISVGIGVAGLGLTSLLVYRYYRLSARRAREASDPRAAQVRALIDEAEHLIDLGRRGAKGAG